MSMNIKDALTTLTNLKEAHKKDIQADVYDIVESVEIPQFASRITREKKEAIKERDNFLEEARAKVKKLAESYEVELGKKPTLKHLQEVLKEIEKSYDVIMDPIIKQQEKEKKMRDEGIQVVNPTNPSPKERKMLAEMNSEIERLTKAIQQKSKNEEVHAWTMAKILKDIPELNDEVPSSNREVVEGTKLLLVNLKERADLEKKAWEKRLKEKGIEGKELEEEQEGYKDALHTEMGKSFSDLRNKIKNLEARFKISGDIGRAILREFDQATRNSLIEFRKHVNKLLPEKGTYGKLYEIREELIRQIDETDAKLAKQLKKEGKLKVGGTKSHTAYVTGMVPGKKVIEAESKASKASKTLNIDEDEKKNLKLSAAQERLEARSKAYAADKNKMQIDFHKAELGGSKAHKALRWIVHQTATRTKIRTEQFKFINAVYQMADKAEWKSPEDKFKFIYTALTVVRDKEPVKSHTAKSRLIAGIDKEIKLIKGAYPDLTPSTEDEFKDNAKKAFNNIHDADLKQNLEKDYSEGYTAINQQAYVDRFKRKK